MTIDPIDEIEDVARRFGISTADLIALLKETDHQRGLLGPGDVEAGLQGILSIYVGALTATAERLENPADRLIVDRFLDQAMEVLASQLEAAPHRSN